MPYVMRTAADATWYVQPADDPTDGSTNHLIAFSLSKADAMKLTHFMNGGDQFNAQAILRIMRETDNEIREWEKPGKASGSQDSQDETGPTR